MNCSSCKVSRALYNADANKTRYIVSLNNYSVTVVSSATSQMWRYGATPLHVWPTAKFCFAVWQLVSVLSIHPYILAIFVENFYCSLLYYQLLESSELHSSDRIRRQGKKDQRPSSNSGPTLYRGVPAMRAIDPSRDPLSPITLKYQSRVCRYPAAA